MSLQKERCLSGILQPRFLRYIPSRRKHRSQENITETIDSCTESNCRQRHLEAGSYRSLGGEAGEMKVMRCNLKNILLKKHMWRRWQRRTRFFFKSVTLLQPFYFRKHCLENNTLGDFLPWYPKFTGTNKIKR